MMKPARGAVLSTISEQVPFPSWFINEDECITCIYQNENWGDNNYCKECRKKCEDKCKNT